MREKAFLYASCFDSSIRKRSDNPSIDFQSYAVNCIKEGMRIADVVERKDWLEWSPRPHLTRPDVDLCSVGSSIYGVPIYDFLKDADTSRVVDYYKLKGCLMKKLQY